ncbi:MAG: signal peptidase I [Candidatus Buchananbacteria bacterium]|nr:signal peptidase I [Candidatus Buchananbacteria bacterium]
MRLFKKKYPKYLADELTMGQEFLIFAWEILKIVVISLVIIVPVRYFLIKPFYVKGASMEPNFHDYQYLIIDELTYRFNAPQRGDVVVFRYPVDPNQYFIKRVIGLPGEEVKIKNGLVTIINAQHPAGVVLNEPYLPFGLQTNHDLDVSLDAQHYFLMGDNRPNSLDSRIFGPVDGNHIIGRVLLRGWPIDKIGYLASHVDYNFD